MKRRYNRFFSRRMLSYLAVVCFGIIIYFALNNYTVLMSSLSRLFTVASPFIYGAVIAFLLDIPTRYFEGRFFSKFARQRLMAILTTYLCTMILLVLFFRLVIPQTIESALILLGNVNQYLNNLNNLMDYFGRQFHLGPESVDQFRLSYEDILNRLLSMVRELLPDIVNISMKIGSRIVTILTAIIASVYMLAGKAKLFRQCRRALYAFAPRQTADAAIRILNLSSGIFSGFIGGKIFESAIVGVICLLGMSLLNATLIEMPFIPLVTLIVAVTNVIPFFGPVIGAIFSSMILLIVNPMSAFWFMIFITIVQQIDGNYLGPRILGVSTGLPPFWVLVAIIVGGGLFGFAGMMAGVPAVAVLHSLISELIDVRLRATGLNSEATANARADGVGGADGEGVGEGEDKGVGEGEDKGAGEGEDRGAGRGAGGSGAT